MPVRVVGIVDCIHSLGVDGVFDIQQDAVAGACAGSQADCGIGSNVVALVGVGGLFGAFVVAAAIVQAVERAGSRIDEDARAGNDLRLLRGGDRNLDDIDAEERSVGVLVRRFIGAAGEFFGLADEGCSGDVNVDVALVVRIQYERVGMRTSAGLDGCYLFRILDIGDVKDADASKAVRAGSRESPLLFMTLFRRWRWRKTLRPAIQATVRHFDRHEEKIAIDRYVALPAGADK